MKNQKVINIYLDCLDEVFKKIQLQEYYYIYI